MGELTACWMLDENGFQDSLGINLKETESDIREMLYLFMWGFLCPITFEVVPAKDLGSMV